MSYHVSRIPGSGTLEDAFAVRRAVFIDEQDVAEEIEMDGRDEDAIHFVIVDAETDTAVGTARLRPPNGEYAKPERVAVRETYRGEGLGARLMGLIESEARTLGCERSVLHAQKQVVEFYRGLGYEVTSDEFEEAGIVHVEMEKRL
ncbi:GNAT family N-acetyltransferase [Halovenus sp. HT40]|uniref:GNAT family N-acetyltransferase n=1 Tax=Halovenus sp. HT40 TaxID=3126691 RepID=UPI00300EC131